MIDHGVRPLTDEALLEEMRQTVKRLTDLAEGMKRRGYNIALSEKESERDLDPFAGYGRRRSLPLTTGTRPLELSASRYLKVDI